MRQVNSGIRPFTIDDSLYYNVDIYLCYMLYSRSRIIRKTLYFYASSSDCIRALNTSPALLRLGAWGPL